MGSAVYFGSEWHILPVMDKLGGNITLQVFFFVMNLTVMSAKLCGICTSVFLKSCYDQSRSGLVSVTSPDRDKSSNLC